MLTSTILSALQSTAATGTTAAGTAATAATGTAASSGTGSSSSGSSSSSSSTGGVAGTSLGGTDFLTLMLAQLQNQDPTSPIDSNAFLTQLAQLSEVQGIQNLNSSFTTLSNSLVSNQALQASSLLGHQALVGADGVTLATAGATVNGAVEVPQNSSDVTVNITNSSGVLVGSVDLGAQSSGLANFSWNGQTSGGSAAPAGTYQLTALVNGVASGTQVQTFVSGTVESVTMGSGSSGLVLNVAGIGNVPFSDVEQISN